jgi:hypothetical protein
MFLLKCEVRIVTQLSLEELGEVISLRLLGGIPMGGREEYIYDEVPAIFAEKEVLGARFVLSGEPDEEGYFLDLDSRMVITLKDLEEADRNWVDLSGLVVALLEEDERLKVWVNPS